MIVLSEERGEIRAVEGGVISDALDPTDLERRIHAWIDRHPPAASERAAAAASERGAAASRADMKIEVETREGPSASTSSTRGVG